MVFVDDVEEDPEDYQHDDSAHEHEYIRFGQWQ